MELQLDTSSQELVLVRLIKQGKIVKELSQKNKFGSQALLPLVQRLLVKGKLELKDISGINVNNGPGSYTGLRVGISVANALAFGLGVKVNGKKLVTNIEY